MAKARKVKKTRKIAVDPKGRVYLMASFNNVIITMTNQRGQVITWASAGKAGFKGSKKEHPLCCSTCCWDSCKRGLRCRHEICGGIC